MMAQTNESTQSRAVAWAIALALLVTLIFSTVTNATAEEDGNVFNVIPLFQYEYVSLASQSIHSPSIGAVLTGGNTQTICLYTRRALTEPLLFGYPDVYHTIEFLLEANHARNQWLLIFKSESDKPVTGGWDTFQAAGMYGREWVRTSRFSFVAGIGLAVSDFGIEMSDGTPWVVIPVPLVRAKYDSRWFSANFDFITNPCLDMTVAPKSHVRLITEVRADQFRTSRDLIFSFALAYRFFSPESEIGDFAGVAFGVDSDAYNYTLGRDDELLDISYYGVFGEIDLSLLKCTVGYAFAGQEWYREDIARKLGSGYYLAVQALYQF